MSPDKSIRRIINGIKQGKSVLFIGPDLVKTPDNQTVRESLCHFLGVDNDPELIYDAVSEFFIFKNEMSKFETYAAIQEFYEHLPAHPIYDKIAQIPFALMVSFNPDLFLKQAFDRYELEYSFDYYSATQLTDYQDLEPPTPEVPLLYNLAGSMQDDTSLIFGYNDLLNYIPAVSGAKKIPNAVRMALKSAGQGNYVFLGFQFDKWYVKLLLKILGITGGYSFGFEGDTHSTSQIFCVNRLDIRFIKYSPEQFVEVLHQGFEAERILRVSTPNEDSDFIKTLKKKIAQNDIESSIEDLLDYLEEKDEDLFDEMIQLSARYNGLQRKISKEIIREEDRQITENQIKVSLMQLLRAVRQWEVSG